MRPTIGLEDVIVKILHTQAQSCDAQFAQGFELVLLECARFALEGDLLGFVPGEKGLESIHQSPDLVDREIRRRAASDIDKLERAMGQVGVTGQDFDLANERIEIEFDITGIFVSIDPKIAELAAFAAKWNVEIKAQGAVSGRGGEAKTFNTGQIFLVPEGKRGVIGNEIIA